MRWGLTLCGQRAQADAELIKVFIWKLIHSLVLSLSHSSAVGWHFLPHRGFERSYYLLDRLLSHIKTFCTEKVSNSEYLGAGGRVVSPRRFSFLLFPPSCQHLPLLWAWLHHTLHPLENSGHHRDDCSPKQPGANSESDTSKLQGITEAGRSSFTAFFQSWRWLFDRLVQRVVVFVFGYLWINCQSHKQVHQQSIYKLFVQTVVC